VRVDPVGSGELVKQRAVEAAGLGNRRLRCSPAEQSGVASRGQPLVATMGEFAIEQEAEPVGMAECASLTGGFEFGKA
jgi:hypothetical protein